MRHHWLWILSICEHIARAARTLWSRGSWLGGALVSALCLCCFLAHRFLYGIVVVLLFVCLLYRCHTNPWGDTMLSSFSYIADAYERISWSPAGLFFGFCFVLFFFVWFFGVFCFLLFSLFAFCLTRWQLNGLCINPIQFSFECTLSTGLMLPLI